MTRTNHFAGQRRGFSLAAALIALFAVALTTASLMSSVVASAQQQRRQQWQIQADAIAEAGRIRAVQRLQHEANYSGEAWRLTLRESGLEADGLATIRVQQRNDQVIVSVVASYPAQGTHRAAAACQFVYSKGSQP